MTGHIIIFVISATIYNDDIIFLTFYFKLYLRSLALSYPISLRLFDGFRPIKPIQVLKHPIRVFRYFKYPLPNRLFLHQRTAPLALIPVKVFVRESGLA